MRPQLSGRLSSAKPRPEQLVLREEAKRRCGGEPYKRLFELYVRYYADAQIERYTTNGYGPLLQFLVHSVHLIRVYGECNP